MFDTEDLIRMLMRDAEMCDNFASGEFFDMGTKYRECAHRIAQLDIVQKMHPLKPNSETIDSMRDASAGNVLTAETSKSLFDMLK